MIRILSRIHFLALVMGGLLALQPFDSNAAPASKGKKTTKSKRTNKTKRTSAQKKKVADAKACAASCKKHKKGTKVSRDCYKKCLKSALTKKSGATNDNKTKGEKRGPHGQSLLKDAPKGTAEIYLPGHFEKSTVHYTVSAGQAIDGCINLGPVKGLEQRYSKPTLPKAIAKLLPKKKGSRGGAAVSRRDYLWPLGKIPYLVRDVEKPGSSRDAKYTADVSEKNGKLYYRCQGSNKGKFELKRDTEFGECGMPTKAEIATAVQNIRAAAKELTDKTKLNFVEITTAEIKNFDYYLDFGWEPNGQCWSKVGRHSTNGQALRCDYTNPQFDKNGIMHEMLHAAGFYHTMARQDQKDHITLGKYNTCRRSFAIQNNYYFDYCFDKGSVQVGDYDLESIMHYSSQQCNYWGSPSYVLAKPATVFGKKLKKGSQVRGPKSRPLSAGDIKMINEVYKSVGETNRSRIDWYCYWKGATYRDNLGSRGSKGRKIRKCQEKCGVGSARTKKGRKVLKCRAACVK